MEVITYLFPQTNFVVCFLVLLKW